MTKISDLTALTGAGVDSTSDLLPIVDMSAAGSARNKKITIDEAKIGLGLGTAASPQFAGVNVGHASDTTITRASAGVIAVEGVNVVTTAGGVTFAADISVPDEAYDATAWNGSVEVPTKNAVRDKIEDILDGVTFTGDIIVPDEAYDATAWNGSLEVPTKNAVRDKIESLGGGSFTAASTTEVLTGTDSSKGVTPDSLAALWEQGSDVASAGTVSLGEGGYFNITGTTTITDIDFATDKAGRHAWVKFAGALTLTHNASTLILPTGANITTAAGDTACFVSEGADAVRCVSYQRASGAALSSSGSSGVTIIRLIQGTGSLTTINVNSTSYVAVGLYFTVNIDSFPFTQYQIIGQGQSNAAGQTVSLQLATFGAPTTPIHTGGDDITGIPNTGGSPIRTSGWLTRDDGVTTGYKEYAVVAKGSNSTVDLQFNYLDIWLK